MTVTLESVVTYLGDGAAEVRFSSDLENPTFYVYRDGVLLYRTFQGSARIAFRRGAPPVIDVFDDENDRPGFASGATTQVRILTAGADALLIERDGGGGYEVEQYVEAEEIQHVLDTGRLAEAGENFRVTPIVQSEPQTPEVIAANPVRLPYPPAVSLSFDDETKQVTVAAA